MTVCCQLLVQWTSTTRVHFNASVLCDVTIHSTLSVCIKSRKCAVMYSSGKGIDISSFYDFDI